jgi:hypothetical protein
MIYFRQEGLGDGPMRSCYVLAAQRLLDRQTSMGIWEDRNGALIPKLSPSDEGPYSVERLSEYRLVGTFSALYLLIMRHPMPRLSPHILVVLLSGSCPPSYDYLKSSDPDAAKVLAPWFNFISQGTTEDSTKFGTFRLGDIHHLCSDYLDTQVCIHVYPWPLSINVTRHSSRHSLKIPPCARKAPSPCGTLSCLAVDRSADTVNGRPSSRDST